MLHLSSTPDGLENTRALGQLIYTDYIFLFQAAGLILMVAMIGAIVLTHRDRPRTRRQNIARAERPRRRRHADDDRSRARGEGIDLAATLRPLPELVSADEAARARRRQARAPESM